MSRQVEPQRIQVEVFRIAWERTNFRRLQFSYHTRDKAINVEKTLVAVYIPLEENKSQPGPSDVKNAVYLQRLEGKCWEGYNTQF